MNEILQTILNSSKSITSKNSSIAHACKRGDLNWLNEIIIDDIPMIEKVYLYTTNSTIPICKHCGSKVNFKGLSRGYQIFCSNSCKGSYNQKVNGESIHEKKKKTLLSKYGVDNALRLESSKQNQREAMSKKKGIKLSEDHKNKTKASILEKYGVENVSQNKEIRLKIDKTMTERYGGYYVGSYKMQTHRKELWINRKLELLESVYECKLLEPYIHSKRLHLAECKNCNNSFDISLSNGHISRCPTCYFKPANKSKLEQDLSNWVQSLGLTILTNHKNKNQIWPLSLDVWIPDLNIGIEVNGDYWHSEKNRGAKYHLEKLKKCEEKNISLIQIFEHELLYKRPVILDRLKSVLGKNEHFINGRNCIIRELSLKEEQSFFNNNHIQGYIPSMKCFGLEHNNEIVQAISIGIPRFNKKYDLELLRLASLRNHSVRGGGSKLFKFLKSQFKFKSMISYHDKRWGTNKIYATIGFEKVNNSSPSYVYVKSDEILSRYQTQKSKLKKLLGDKFDQNLTETENMEKNKYHKLWDCGQEIWAITL